MYKARVCIVLCTVLLFQMAAGQVNASDSSGKETKNATSPSSSTSSGKETTTRNPGSGSSSGSLGLRTLSKNPGTESSSGDETPSENPESDSISESSGEDTPSENPGSSASSESSGEETPSENPGSDTSSESIVEEKPSENPSTVKPAKISTGKNCTSQCQRPEFPSKIQSRNALITDEMRSRTKLLRSGSRDGRRPIRTECKWSCPAESWDKDGILVACGMTQTLYFWGEQDPKVTSVICRKSKGCPVAAVGKCLDMVGDCFIHCPQRIRPPSGFLKCGDECGYEGGSEVCTRTAWVTDFDGIETKRVNKCRSATSCSGDDVGICEDLKDKDPAYGRPCWDHCKDIMG